MGTKDLQENFEAYAVDRVNKIREFHNIDLLLNKGYPKNWKFPKKFLNDNVTDKLEVITKYEKILAEEKQRDLLSGELLNCDTIMNKNKNHCVGSFFVYAFWSEKRRTKYKIETIPKEKEELEQTKGIAFLRIFPDETEEKKYYDVPIKPDEY